MINFYEDKTAALMGSKKFYKTVAKSKKSKTTSSISCIADAENDDELVYKEKAVANLFNRFFTSLVCSSGNRTRAACVKGWNPNH
jgi:hypothetical protein